MNDDHREAIRKSNQRRSLACGKCGAINLEILDGSKCGGMSGIQYRVCNGCGEARAITKRPGRVKLK